MPVCNWEKIIACLKNSTACINYSANTYYISQMLPVSWIIPYIITAWKVSKYGVISGPYFPEFRLNTEIYELNLRSKSPYSVRIQTRNNSVFGHFSRSV